MSDDGLAAAGRRAALAWAAGETPTTEDLEVGGLLIARDDGCDCALEDLVVTVTGPDVDGDPRPVVRIDGHANTCPCLQAHVAANN